MTGHEAQVSTSGRRPAKRKRHDVVFRLKTARRGRKSVGYRPKRGGE